MEPHMAYTSFYIFYFNYMFRGNNDSTNLITESTERELLIPDIDRQPTQNSTSIIQQQDGHCSSPPSGRHTSRTNQLPSQPSTSDSLYSSLFNNEDVIEVYSDSEFASTDEEVKITNLVSESSLQDILSGLAKKIDESKISKFDVWSGAKRFDKEIFLSF